jgi:hypothetical protein
MPVDARAAAQRAARELLGVLAELTEAPTLRVTDADGRLACLIQVWGVPGMMPTAAGQRRKTGGRAECRADILAAVAAAGRALTYKEVMRALRTAGKAHGPGTVTKALAELTSAGDLVNPLDKKGYRLASWPTPGTPPLF